MLKQLAQLPLLVLMLGALALLSWIPAAHATIMQHHQTAQAFFYAGLFLLVIAVMLAIATHAITPRNAAYSRLAAVAGAYLLLPFAMALPFAMSLPSTSWLNAWFEMLSSFTTTGASVYEPSQLSPTLHLWRAMMGWFGGFFILLAAFAILAPLNLGGAEVMSGRALGRAAGLGGRFSAPLESNERMHRYIGIIFPVYAGLTLILWMLLLMAGETGLIALSHAMGTLSTSGISAGGGLFGTGSGLLGEIFMFFFMLLALCRHLMPFPGIHLRHGPLREDPELRLGLAIIAAVTIVLLLRHIYSDAFGTEIETIEQFMQAFWGAAFSAASFLTTTGYESQWWETARHWSGMGSTGLLLLGLAMIGGGVATTAGGVTLLRLYALLIHGRRELDRVIHPNAVGRGGAEKRRLASEGAYMAWVFFMLFGMSLAVVMGLLTVLGLPFEEALILSVSALTTTGPLAEVAGSEPVAWSVQSAPVKLVLAATMILGRIEAIALIALLAPASWRR